VPSLLIFVPCERIAFDQANNSVSLIGIFQGYTVTKLETQVEKIPRGAEPLTQLTSLPIRWAAFALWRRLPGDQGKEFEQRVEVVAPSGAISIKTKPLRVTITNEFHRVSSHISGFPIGEQGDYLVKLFFGESGADLPEVASYPIGVTIESKSEKPS